MKWYFACNDKSSDFFPLIKAAVNSAMKNTDLEPHFIYDGEENELTQWLKEHRVKVIRHRVSFYDALEKHYGPQMLAIASGAFLRCDIPLLEQEDEFVLYTDCDVLFLQDIKSDFKTDIKPKYFACSSQTSKNNFTDFNTGVMVMNVKELRKTHDKFRNFIIKNLGILNTFDQSAYQIFYGGKNTNLATIYNHKPYWGVDKNAVILHFHGCKPTTFTSEEALKHLPYMHYQLYKKNPKAYDFYLDLYRNYGPEIRYSVSGMENLKKGLYPLDKGGKTPLLIRIKTRLAKECKKLLRKIGL